MACRRYGSTPTRRCTRTWPSTPGWASRRPGADATAATGASSCASGFADGASGWFAAGPIPIHPTSGKGYSPKFALTEFSEVRAFMLTGMQRRGGTMWLVAPGLATIAVTYGLARFAYGLFLPQMRESLDLSDSVLGLIGAGSYAGYCL